MSTFGVHSEVGTLRTVLVCRPGLAHQRLTPGNRASCCSTTCSGCTRRRRITTTSCSRCGSAASRSSSCTICWPKPLLSQEARGWILDRRITATTSAPASRRSCARGSASFRRRSSPSTDRRDRVSRSARNRADRDARRCLRRHRLHRPAGAQHAVSARPVVLDLRRLDGQRCSGPPASRRRCSSARSQVPPAFQARTSRSWGDCDDSFGAATVEAATSLPIGRVSC